VCDVILGGVRVNCGGFCCFWGSAPNVVLVHVRRFSKSKFRLRRLPLQRCGHDGAHACRVFMILCQDSDAIRRHLNSVYATCCVFVMFKKIENTASCEMRPVIRFLNAKNICPILGAPNSKILLRGLSP
jgi:hypothetical protein